MNFDAEKAGYSWLCFTTKKHHLQLNIESKITIHIRLYFDLIDLIYYLILTTIGTMPFLLVGVIQNNNYKLNIHAYINTKQDNSKH